jgi:site-specific DNA-cytosine methylase
VLEVFAGGATMTAALTGNATFQVVPGVEIELDFAHEWQTQHPEATLVQSDIRALHPSELPEFDVLIGGIPFTCHSNLGRAKKSLAGKPELGGQRRLDSARGHAGQRANACGGLIRECAGLRQ